MAHVHHGSDNLKRVLVGLALTGSFMIVEVIGGLLSGSLALLADAGHMLTDSMALLLAAVAFHISRRPPNERLTFGYQRFQILAAFVNGLSLLLIVGWIIVEAVQRLRTPEDVAGPTMLGIAAIGLLVNIVVFLVLHSGDQDNLNIRAAALHVVGDLLGSVAAITAAVIIIYTGWMPIDPLLSLLIAALILKSAWTLVRRSAHVLLEGAPDGLDLEEMQTSIVASVPAVANIHHVHVWGITPQELMLTMHVRLAGDCDQPTEIVRTVKSLLSKRYGIGHSTIEVETEYCADEGC